MKRRDISNEIIVLCAAECRRQIERDDTPSGSPRQWRCVDEILAELFGAPEKVIFAAMHRAADANLIDYGVHIRGAWPTDEGEALMERLGLPIGGYPTADAYVANA